MKKNISKRRLEAIQALAARGTDGEQQNAKNLLAQFEFTCTPDKPNYTQDGCRTAFYLPFIEYMPLSLRNDETDVRAEALTIADAVITSFGLQVYAVEGSKIICLYKNGYNSYQVETAIRTAVYNLLVSLKVPVLYGEDCAGWGCKTDEMEDGTINGISQFEACYQYTSPDMEHEIWSAARLEGKNKFVAVTNDRLYWGAITETAPDTITIKPLNPKYPATTLQRSDVVNLYRTETMGGGWACVKPEQRGDLEAAQARYKAIHGKDK